MIQEVRPGRGDIATTLSEDRIASGMSWVTKPMAFLAISQILSRSRHSPSRVIASRAAKGSSISSMEGLWTSAQQLAARCCMPPDSSPGLRVSKPSSPTMRRSPWARSRAAFMSSRRISVGSSTLSRTVRQGNSTGCRKTMPMSLLGAIIGASSTVTVPLVGGIRALMIRRSVDSPHPQGPRRETNSPLDIVRFTSDSATVAPPLTL